MKSFVLYFIFASLYITESFAQSVAINTDGSQPNPTSILDIKSNNKGVLLPRTSTTSRNAILSPAKGLLLYDTTTSGFWFHNGTAWAQLSAGGASNYWTLNGSDIYNNNAGNAGIGINTPAAKLHIKGTANTSQLIIDASATQSNIQPLIRLRDASGVDLLHIHSDNIFNTFIGLNAGRTNTVSPGVGVANTFIGSSAGYSNSTGFYNTAIGQAALYSNLGDYNNAFGVKALFSNTTGSNNTANGYQALYSNSTGVSNTANGYKALYSNSTGNYNSGLGESALFTNSTGNRNTAIGWQALYFNSTGSLNTATGEQSLVHNTTGSSNTANGNYALFSNTTGIENTASGESALFSNTTGNFNVANGKHALYYNTTGNDNTANGYQALYSNTTGSDNIAIGYQALYSNSGGSTNIATGRWSLYSNNTGYNNTATGEQALYANTSGIINTAIGESALNSNTTGNRNTAIGAGALSNNMAGSDNIAIGVASGIHPSTPDVYNTISIGNNDILNAYQNQVIIGNTSTGFIGGKVPWSVISDERVKNNIVEDVIGLNFILKLRPVTYHMSNDAITTLTGSKKTPDFPGKYDGEKIKYSGFLAQEVEQAAKSVNYDFSGFAAPKNKWGLYTLSYEQFVVPLIKAMQEQQAIIDNQQKQIDLLEKRLIVLEAKR